MRTMKAIAVFLLIAAPVYAQDAIDIRSATVERSAGDVAAWPITTTIARLDLGAADCNVEFDKKAVWPEVPIPGWSGGAIAYTLWMVRTVNGQVYTGGGIEFWRTRVGGCGPAAEYIKNWYYDGSWGPLFTAGELTPGEQVGFFVTAGDARAKDVRSITERSAVVAVPWPGGSGGSFSFAPSVPPPVVPPPPPVIVPPVVTPPVVPPPVFDASALERQIAELKADVDAGRAENQAFYEHVGVQWKSIMAFLGKYIAPAVAGILGGMQLGK